MERTRDQVVSLLQERGSLSVSGLASAIGVSHGAIRRHLDIMVGEGLLEETLERQARGRPARHYSLSEAGEERSSHASYSRLLDRLLPALAGLPQEAVEGRPGVVVLEQVFEAVAEEIAGEYAPRVRSSDLGERVKQVTDTLREEGILHESSEDAAEFRLRNVGCPYRSMAEGEHMACMADRRAIELLLDAPVSQVATIVDGAACCEYVVAK
jgi:predicted ArsR family transcriptional regulator